MFWLAAPGRWLANLKPCTLVCMSLGVAIINEISKSNEWSVLVELTQVTLEVRSLQSFLQIPTVDPNFVVD
jgi:hypothetical protein